MNTQKRRKIRVYTKCNASSNCLSASNVARKAAEKLLMENAPTTICRASIAPKTRRATKTKKSFFLNNKFNKENHEKTNKNINKTTKYAQNMAKLIQLFKIA